MKKIIYLLLTLLLIVGCKKNPQQIAPSSNITDIEGEPKGKVLVLYYSQNGATDKVAQEFHRQLRIADIERIELEKPYDADFNKTIKRSAQEKKSGKMPALKPMKLNVDDYDLIFLGFPVWFGTYANPIASLLQQIHLGGKKIVPFCTFGSGGLNTSVDELKKVLVDSEIWPGYGVRNARLDAAPMEINHFLIQNEIIAGEVQPEPTYSPFRPASQKEMKLFHEACDGYPMLHAIPDLVSSCKSDDGTELYVFSAKDKNPEGRLSNVKVKIQVSEGQKAEFTEVIR